MRDDVSGRDAIAVREERLREHLSVGGTVDGCDAAGERAGQAVAVGGGEVRENPADADRRSSDLNSIPVTPRDVPAGEGHAIIVVGNGTSARYKRTLKS